jgi:hypothetical protein
MAGGGPAGGALQGTSSAFSGFPNCGLSPPIPGINSPSQGWAALARETGFLGAGTQGPGKTPPREGSGALKATPQRSPVPSEELQAGTGDAVPRRPSWADEVDPQGIGDVPCRAPAAQELAGAQGAAHGTTGSPNLATLPGPADPESLAPVPLPSAGVSVPGDGGLAGLSAFAPPEGAAGLGSLPPGAPNQAQGAGGQARPPFLLAPQAEVVRLAVKIPNCTPTDLGLELRSDLLSWLVSTPPGAVCASSCASSIF